MTPSPRVIPSLRPSLGPPSSTPLAPLQAVFLALCLALAWPGEARADNSAHGGMMDLRTSGGETPITALDGEWELYWGRLIPPEQFDDAGQAGTSTVIALPRSWDGLAAPGGTTTAQGFATLRLRVSAPPGDERLGLRLFKVNSAYRLFVNGRDLGGSGSVGTSLDTETAVSSVRLFEFDPAADGVADIVLHVSNHAYAEGGIVAPVLLGPADALRTRQAREWGLSLFLAGSLLVMAAYHLALYWLRPKNVAPLLFAAYCLLWLGNQTLSSSSDWALGLFVNGLGGVGMEKTAYLCLIASVPVGYRFFRTLYPQEFSLRWQRLAEGAAVLFAVLAVVCRMAVFTTLMAGYYLLSSLLICYCVARLFRAFRRGLDGAGLLLAGFALLGLVGVNDMLDEVGVIRTGSHIQGGMFVFMLFQTLALARRLARAFTAEEELTTQLEDRNADLEREMAERARLQQEVVSISDDERRRLSHDLHDGLCQQITGALLRCSVLENRVGPEGALATDVGQLSALLDQTAENAYGLSRGLWPVEHRPDGSGPCLEELTRRFSASSGVPIVLGTDLPCSPCRNRHMTQLYRIAQEAVANALKHAAPSRVEVRLDCLDRSAVRLTVRDDGAGIPANAAPKGGLGLAIMKHRIRIIGGDMRIGPAPGGGTLVTCTAPCALDEPNAPEGSPA